MEIHQLGLERGCMVTLVNLLRENSQRLSKTRRGWNTLKKRVKNICSYVHNPPSGTDVTVSVDKSPQIPLVNFVDNVT